MSNGFWRGFREAISIGLNLFCLVFWIVVAVQYKQNPEAISSVTLICSFIICSIFFARSTLDDIIRILEK